MAMTKKRRLALEWFIANGPVGWFDINAPTDVMRRQLVRDGLLEEAGPRENMRVIKFQISQAGREALAKERTATNG